MSSSASVSPSQGITHGVVMIETTTRSLSSVEPYRCLGRDQCIGTGFKVAHKWFPKEASWNRPSNILFLTNWHVVESAENKKVRIRTARNPEYCKGEVVHAVPVLDFAVIAVNTDSSANEEDDPFCSAPGQVLLHVKDIELHVGPLQAQQQKIICCGFPSALEAYVTKGILGGRNSGSDVSDMWQIDCSVNSGNSGGPVCLENDERCFGIATATLAEADQIAYATPISSVLSWFSNHWTEGTCIGRFPRWGFALCPRTDAYDEEHEFPRDLDGAVVSSVKKALQTSNLQEGDVLLSIHRGGTPVTLGKFGMISDYTHGQPRFNINNFGFVCSLPKTTTVTVWRPSLKAKKTFVCAPQPPLETDKSFYQEYADPPYCCLGSMVFMNATADFLRASEITDSEDECDGLPPLKTFHVLRHVHMQKSSQKPKHVVVLSHMHPNAYVSSTRTLEKGDVITKINGVPLKSCQHAEKLVKKAAIQFLTCQGKNRIVLSTPDKKIYLNLQKLLQEETLCLPEREHTKLHLLSECTKSSVQQQRSRDSGGSARVRKQQRQSSRLKRRRENMSISTAKLDALQTFLSARALSGTPTSSRQSSRPSSPARKIPKRRRSQRLQAMAGASS